MSRAVPISLAILVTGCSYPSFGFDPSDPGDPHDAGEVDSAVDGSALDSARLDAPLPDAGNDLGTVDGRGDGDAGTDARGDTAPPQDARDTSVVDTAPEAAPDTTPPPDTAPVPDTAPADTGADVPACAPGLTSCGGACVDTSSTATNCGSCGVVCDRAQPCVAGVCQPLTSCAALKAADSTLPSGAYTIDPDGSGPLSPFGVFCEMSDGTNGWTLALKVDGAQTTFAFDAALWTNDVLLNPGSFDLTMVEAKFRSFNELPVTQVRALMLDGGTSRTITLPVAASSLRALFSGPFVATSAGRASWLSLVADGSLQANCNAEGFNLDFSIATIGPRPRVRLGIVGNQEADCSSPDSFLGFGALIATTDLFCFGGVDPKVTTGDVAGAVCGAPTDKATKTFGMLFVL